MYPWRVGSSPHAFLSQRTKRNQAQFAMASASDPDSSRSRIAVLGYPGTGKQACVRGLFEACGLAPPPDPRQATLSLSNKYYDADLDCVCGGTSAAHPGTEAVVLVVSAAHGDALSELETLAAPLASWDEPPQLVLVLSNKTDLALGVDVAAFSEGCSATDPIPGADAERCATHRALIEQLDAWALDRGYEHVPCCALTPRYTAGSRDKGGLARAAEALSSVVWRGARMRPRGAVSQPPAVPAGGGGAAAEGPGGEAASEPPPPPASPAGAARSGEPKPPDAEVLLDAVLRGDGGAEDDEEAGGSAPGPDIARLIEQVGGRAVTVQCRPLSSPSLLLPPTRTYVRCKTCARRLSGAE